MARKLQDVADSRKTTAKAAPAAAPASQVKQDVQAKQAQYNQYVNNFIAGGSGNQFTGAGGFTPTQPAAGAAPFTGTRLTRLPLNVNPQQMQQFQTLQNVQAAKRNQYQINTPTGISQADLYRTTQEMDPRDRAANSLYSRSYNTPLSTYTRQRAAYQANPTQYAALSATAAGNPNAVYYRQMDALLNDNSMWNADGSYNTQRAYERGAGPLNPKLSDYLTRDYAPGSKEHEAYVRKELQDNQIPVTAENVRQLMEYQMRQGQQLSQNVSAIRNAVQKERSDILGGRFDGYSDDRIRRYQAEAGDMLEDEYAYNRQQDQKQRRESWESQEAQKWNDKDFGDWKAANYARMVEVWNEVAAETLSDNGIQAEEDSDEWIEATQKWGDAIQEETDRRLKSEYERQLNAERSAIPDSGEPIESSRTRSLRNAIRRMEKELSGREADKAVDSLITAAEAMDDYSSLSQAEEADWNQLKPSDQTDLFFKYINADDNTRFWMRQGTNTPTYIADNAERNGYGYLTEKEKAAFNYLYRSGMKEEAQALLDNLGTRLRQRRASENTKKILEDMKSPLAAVWYNALSVPASLVSDVNGFIHEAALLMGADVDPNEAGFDAERFRQTVRQYTSEQIRNWDSPVNFTLPGTNLTIAEAMYGGTMSALETAMRMTAVGSLGSSAVTMMFTGGAMESTLMEDLNKGLDQTTAGRHALFNAIIENATERWSVEALMADPKNYAQHLLKTFVAEGAEEGTGDLLGKLADQIQEALSDGYDGTLTTNRNEYYNAHARPNMSRDELDQLEQEADDYAQSLFVAEVLGDTLVGGISGLEGGASGVVRDAVEVHQATGLIFDNSRTVEMTRDAIDTAAGLRLSDGRKQRVETSAITSEADGEQAAVAALEEARGESGAQQDQQVTEQNQEQQTQPAQPAGPAPVRQPASQAARLGQQPTGAYDQAALAYANQQEAEQNQAQQDAPAAAPVQAPGVNPALADQALQMAQQPNQKETEQNQAQLSENPRAEIMAGQEEITQEESPANGITEAGPISEEVQRIRQEAEEKAEAPAAPETVSITDKLVDMARLANSMGGEAQEMLKATLKKRGNKLEDLTRHDAAKLYKAIRDNLGPVNSQALTDAMKLPIMARLQDMARRQNQTEPNTELVAEAILALSAGESLTKEQRQAMRESPNGMKLLESYRFGQSHQGRLAGNIFTETMRSESVRKAEQESTGRELEYGKLFRKRTQLAEMRAADEAAARAAAKGEEAAAPAEPGSRLMEEYDKAAERYARDFKSKATQRDYLKAWESAKASMDFRNFNAGFRAVYNAAMQNTEIRPVFRAVTDLLQRNAKEAFRLAEERGKAALEDENSLVGVGAGVDSALTTMENGMLKLAPLAVEDQTHDNYEREVKKAVPAGYTGVVAAFSGQRLTHAKRVFVSVLDAMGKKYGTQFIVVDSLQQGKNAPTGEQGMYVTGTNRMYVALDTEEGLLTRTAGHEAWHYIRSTAKQSGNESFRQEVENFENYVLGQLEKTDGYDLATRIKEKIDKYQKAKQKLSEADAREEIMGDSMIDVLNGEKTLDAIADAHPTVVDKLRGFFRDFSDRIRSAFQRLARYNPEARAMLKQSEDTMKQIADKFDALMTRSYAFREALGLNENGEEGEVKLSKADDNHPIRQQIREHSKELSEMPVLVNVSTKSINLQKYYDAGAKSREAARKLWAYEELGKYGEYIHRDNFGDVKITKNRLKIGMNYIYSDAGLAAYLAIPSVIQYGRQIDHHFVHKKRPVNSFTFAAPITIDGIPGNMAVVVHESTEDGEKRYKAHAVLLPNNELLEFDKEEEVGKNTSRHGTNAVEAMLTTSSKNNIAEDGKSVKGNKHSFADDDYLSAVESGDTATAERMVNEAAEKAMADSKLRTDDGKLRKVYHGTYSDGFTVFDKKMIGTARAGDVGFFGKGFYFAYSKGEAGMYGSKVLEAYLDLKNPFNFEKELNSINGERTFDWNGSRAAFIVNFANKLPEIADKHHVTVWEGDNETGRDLTLKEFADAFMDVYNNKEFRVEPLETMDGTEWLVTADPVTGTWTDSKGKEHKYTDYKFQKRYYSEKDARNKINQTYEYLSSRVFNGIHMPNSVDIVQETDFTEALKKRGYDGAIQSESGDEAVAFESEQIKSADPVTYDDDGNVIPLSERFNPEKKDIRYSLADVEPADTGMDALVAENEGLKKTVEALQQELAARHKGTAGHTFSKTAMRDLARRIKNEYHTSVPVQTLADNLTTVFEAMANARNGAEVQGAMQAMSDIAYDALNRSQELDTEAYDEYEDFRDYIRHTRFALTGTQWREVEHMYDGKKGFRQAARGLHIAPEGKEHVGERAYSLDSLWGEMHEMWPALFPEQVNEGAQPAVMLAAVAATEKQLRNPYENNQFGTLDDYANDLALKIYDWYMDTPETKTPAKKIQELRAQLRQTQSELRKAADLNERTRKYREEMLKAFHEKSRRQAQRRADSEQYRKDRAQIIRQRASLQKKLVQPQIGQFVPYNMRTAVEALLRATDFDGSTTGERTLLSSQMMEQVRDAYQSMTKGESPESARGPLAAYYNEDLLEDFGALIEALRAQDKGVAMNGKRAENLTAQELNHLKNIVAGFHAAVINADSLFMRDRKQSLTRTGDELIAQLENGTGRLVKGKDGKERLVERYTVQGEGRKMLADAFRRGLLKPVTVFGRMKGTAMEAVWDNLRKAEFKHIRHVQEAGQYLQEALTNYNQQESINQEGTAKKRKAAQALTLASGRTLQLTDQEAMTIYAYSKREPMIGTNHLLGGGITLRNAGKGSSLEGFRLTKGDLAAIIGTLSEEQKNYVDHMVGYLSTTCAEWGNEVTLQMYGAEKFTEGYYLPLKVNQKGLAVQEGVSQDQRLKFGSMTKAITQSASTSLEIVPFTELWCEHVEKMSDYNAFVLPIEDMTRLLNYKQGYYDDQGKYVAAGENVRQMMDRRYGQQHTAYISSFLSRMNGNSRSDFGGSWLNRFMGKSKGASVTFNLSVALQQMGAGTRALAEMDFRDVAPGLAKGITFGKSYEELMQYAPIAVEKSWGYFDTQQLQGLYGRSRETFSSKLNDVGGYLAGKGDELNWAQIWEACKHEARRLNPNLTDEEMKQRAAERFAEVIDKTQVVDSVFQRAEWATEKGMMKRATAFMSEPLTQYNMYVRAITDFMDARALGDKAGEKKAALALLRNMKAIVISSAVTAALKSMVTAIRRRDTEKKEKDENGKTVIVGVKGWHDRALEDFLPNFADNLLGAGTIFTNMFQDATSFGGSSDLTTQAVTYALQFGKELLKIAQGEEPDLDRLIYLSSLSAGYFSGTGLGSAYRDARALVMTLYEKINRDALAGTAWDKDKPLDVRLASAKANYVYSREAKTGSQKVNTGIWYDLLLDTYAEDGLGENFRKVADAAIAAGATESGLESGFRARLAAAESRIPEAARALNDGDMVTYSRLVKELEGAGIGSKAINSMVEAEYRKLQPKEEKEAGTGEGLITGLQREAKATEAPEAKKAKTDMKQALLDGDETKLINAEQILTRAGYFKNEKALNGKRKAMIGEMYKEGDIDDARAEALLKKYGGLTDANDRYWQMDKWREEVAHADDADYSWSKFDGLKETITSGRPISSAMSELRSHGMTEKQVYSKVRSLTMEMYRDGEISRTKAESMLRQYNGGPNKLSDTELYWEMNKLDYAKQNGSSDGWSKYYKLYDALEAGNNQSFQAAAREVREHWTGTAKSTRTDKGKNASIASSIVSHYKDQYVELVSSGRKSEAARLKSRILSGVSVLGLNTAKYSRTIDGWIK